MAINRTKQARQMLKKGTEPVEQAGVMNYMPSEMVIVPKVAKSSPEHPTAKLAYITDKEKKLLIEKDLHGSLKGKPNKGPGGIPSLQGDFDSSPGSGMSGGFASGEQLSGFETGNKSERSRADARSLGFSPQDVQDIRSGAIASGAGRTVNPSFFGPKNRPGISKFDLRAARQFSPKAFRATRGSPFGFGNIATGLLSLINPALGLFGKAFNFMKDKAQDLRGYNPDGSPRTQVEYELAMQQKSLQNRLDNLYDRKFSGKSYSQKNIDMLEAMGVTTSKDSLKSALDRDLEINPEMPQFAKSYLQSIDTTPNITATNLNDLQGLTERDFIDRVNLNDLEGILADKGLVEVPADFIDQGEIVPLATGGRVNAMGGGIMDLETGRQMYGLGKLVKKATRAVKKIAKSPIGKAALLYTATGGLGNLAAGKGFGSFFSGFTSPSTFLGRAPGIFTKGGLQNIASRIGLGKFKNIGGERLFEANKLGSFLSSPFGVITSASALAGLLTPKEEQEGEFDLDEYYKQVAFNPNAELTKRILGTQFVADGGRIGYAEGSKEPVAKKVMPLLDMDGMEKDYRAEGGFVPIGRMEKADDVPARLSKNEFVFTADAVRNAGGGDVDKGAEVMYNMMKNLEAGGEVSEKSQGLEGAREMFQTSQRLGEVI